MYAEWGSGRRPTSPWRCSEYEKTNSSFVTMVSHSVSVHPELSIKVVTRIRFICRQTWNTFPLATNRRMGGCCLTCCLASTICRPLQLRIHRNPTRRVRPPRTGHHRTRYPLHMGWPWHCSCRRYRRVCRSEDPTHTCCTGRLGDVEHVLSEPAPFAFWGETTARCRARSHGTPGRAWDAVLAFVAQRCGHPSCLCSLTLIAAFCWTNYLNNLYALDFVIARTV